MVTLTYNRYTTLYALNKHLKGLIKLDGSFVSLDIDCASDIYNVWGKGGLNYIFDLYENELKYFLTQKDKAAWIYSRREEYEIIILAKKEDAKIIFDDFRIYIALKYFNKINVWISKNYQEGSSYHRGHYLSFGVSNLNNNTLDEINNGKLILPIFTAAITPITFTGPQSLNKLIRSIENIRFITQAGLVDAKNNKKGKTVIINNVINDIEVFKLIDTKLYTKIAKATTNNSLSDDYNSNIYSYDIIKYEINEKFANKFKYFYQLEFVWNADFLEEYQKSGLPVRGNNHGYGLKAITHRFNLTEIYSLITSLFNCLIPVLDKEISNQKKDNEIIITRLLDKLQIYCEPEIDLQMLTGVMDTNIDKLNKIVAKYDKQLKLRILLTKVTFLDEVEYNEIKRDVDYATIICKIALDNKYYLVTPKGNIVYIFQKKYIKEIDSYILNKTNESINQLVEYNNKYISRILAEYYKYLEMNDIKGFIFQETLSDGQLVYSPKLFFNKQLNKELILKQSIWLSEEKDQNDRKLSYLNRISNTFRRQNWEISVPVTVNSKQIHRIQKNNYFMYERISGKKILPTEITDNQITDCIRMLVTFFQSGASTNIGNTIKDSDNIFHFINDLRTYYLELFDLARNIQDQKILCIFLNQLDIAEQELDSYKYNLHPKSLIHGDFSLGNVLFKDGKPYGLIDIDRVEVGTIIKDLLVFLTSINRSLRDLSNIQTEKTILAVNTLLKDHILSIEELYSITPLYRLLTINYDRECREGQFKSVQTSSRDRADILSKIKAKQINRFWDKHFLNKIPSINFKKLDFSINLENKKDNIKSQVQHYYQVFHPYLISSSHMVHEHDKFLESFNQILKSSTKTTHLHLYKRRNKTYLLDERKSKVYITDLDNLEEKQYERNTPHYSKNNLTYEFENVETDMLVIFNAGIGDLLRCIDQLKKHYSFSNQRLLIVMNEDSQFNNFIIDSLKEIAPTYLYIKIEGSVEDQRYAAHPSHERIFKEYLINKVANIIKPQRIWNLYIRTTTDDLLQYSNNDEWWSYNNLLTDGAPDKNNSNSLTLKTNQNHLTIGINIRDNTAHRTTGNTNVDELIKTYNTLRTYFPKNIIKFIFFGDKSEKINKLITSKQFKNETYTDITQLPNSRNFNLDNEVSYLSQINILIGVNSGGFDLAYSNMRKGGLAIRLKADRDYYHNAYLFNNKIDTYDVEPDVPYVNLLSKILYCWETNKKTDIKYYRRISQRNMRTVLSLTKENKTAQFNKHGFSKYLNDGLKYWGLTRNIDSFHFIDEYTAEFIFQNQKYLLSSQLLVSIDEYQLIFVTNPLIKTSLIATNPILYNKIVIIGDFTLKPYHIENYFLYFRSEVTKLELMNPLHIKSYGISGIIAEAILKRGI